MSVTDALNTVVRGAAGYQVDPAILRAASQRLMNSTQSLLRALGSAGDLQVPICGPDPVSRPTADGLNAKIHPIVQQSTAFANNLRDAAAQLAQQSASYETSDQHARSSFRDLNGGKP